MNRYVFDTNIVSGIMRQDQQIINRMRSIAAPGDIVYGCPVVWFEVRRGLLAKDAKLQMRIFESLFAKFTWQDYISDDWSLAAEWWAKRRVTGIPISDADVLVAVFAYNRDAVLVTNNEKDFLSLGVTVENWTK